MPWRYIIHTPSLQVREREDIRDDSQPEVIPYGRFDPFNAWRQTVYSGASAPRDTVSPLMTSMQCFVNDLEIEGRDILDTNPSENPLFYDYNHVLIPYCSSDLWLGEETDATSAVRPGVSKCSCFNYVTESKSDGCFNFHNADDLLFTFRGKTIYQSVIQQLLANHNMSEADKLILAGSSAGRLGVINHAKWTRGVLDCNTDLRVLFDSSWFVDFQDGIESVFNLATSENSDSSDTQRLLTTIRSNEACNNTDRVGYPCCISAHCVLTQRNSSDQLQYYPENTPTFALFSVYDIYLLAPGLATVANVETASNTENDGSGNAGIGIVLDFLRIAGEYGGTMNSTLDLVTTQVGVCLSVWKKEKHREERRETERDRERERDTSSP